MGIHGLTTFLQKYHDKYKESIYLRDCPVLIDGCNLMFFLYFEGKQALPPNTPKKGTATSPLSKASPLKKPHLFGGDYMTYAQNVREFFQHLKLCGITSIVLFDGAYDSMKIKTAFKRFADNLKENVRSSGNSLKGVTPGPSYAPVFMKAVFVEILQEQKILHYQTEGEADCTIAFIARKLGNCPILSSDSDFHIFTNAVVLPLHTLRFKKVIPLKGKRDSSPSTLLEKVWMLHSQFVSLPKLCRQEFNLQDLRLLPLAAVILGNDWIRSGTFAKFHSTKAGGNKVKRTLRIAYLLKWLGKQKSYERVVRAMISTIRDSQMEKTRKLVDEIVAIYQGNGGEESVWKLLYESDQVKQYISSEEKVDDSEILEELVEKLSLEESGLLEVSVIDDEEASGLHEHEDEDSNSEEEDASLQELNEDDHSNETKLPEWYLNAHIKCWFPTYLLKLFRNKMVFLSPQAEISVLPSTHSLSTPIIKVTGGLLLGKTSSVTLLTRHKSKITQEQVETTTFLEHFGPIPLISEDCSEFKKQFSFELRAKLIFETVGLLNSDFIDFVDQWPVSIRFWIICLVYFIKCCKTDPTNECEYTTLVNKSSTPVAIAILLSIIKNSVLNPSGSTRNNSSADSSDSRISKLLNQEASNIAKLRLFYAKFESVSDTCSRSFSRSYDITRTYNLSRFTCIIFHLYQLNRLIGDPFKAPKLNYNLNNWFVYNVSGALLQGVGEIDETLEPSSSLLGNIVQELCGVIDMKILVEKLLCFA